MGVVIAVYALYTVAQVVVAGTAGGGRDSNALPQKCNVYGCGYNPNVYGSSPRGTCTVYGCP